VADHREGLSRLRLNGNETNDRSGSNSGNKWFLLSFVFMAKNQIDGSGCNLCHSVC